MFCAHVDTPNKVKELHNVEGNNRFELFKLIEIKLVETMRVVAFTKTDTQSLFLLTQLARE